jgi:imidazolonepropionase-like amidohydrolase
VATGRALSFWPVSYRGCCKLSAIFLADFATPWRSSRLRALETQRSQSLALKLRHGVILVRGKDVSSMQVYEMKTLWLALALSACMAGAQEPPAAGFAIRHVTVVNVATGAELKDQTVRIEGNRIAAIAATQDADAAIPGVIDAHGSYLIPGLWDMHVHVHDKDELPLYIANGVTGIRIMSGERDESRLRAELARESPSPEIYLASAIVDGSPPVWPGSIVVKKPADARRAVDEIKASGADFVKVYNRIPRDTYFSLADEAKQQHIDFEGHVPEAITAQEASAAGQRSIEHLTGIALACSDRQERLIVETEHAEFFRDKLRIEADGFRSFDSSKCQALFAEFKHNSTWQVPTLSVLQLWGRLDDSKFLSDPRQAYIDRRFRNRWQERIQFQMRHWTFVQFELARDLFRAEKQTVGLMFRAGVPLMAGTDAMNPYCFPGFSLHDELAMMVESGLTPLAALQAATINPATFMGKTAEMGTIEAGKIANLVLLAGDPLADIHNTKQIEGVWLEGKYFDAAALAKLLEQAKEGARH